MHKFGVNPFQMDQACISSSQSTEKMERSASSSMNLVFGASQSSEVEILDENVIIDEITEIEPTSAILSYCKRKFLRPYVTILGLAGLRPMSVDTDLNTILGHIQTFVVLLLLVVGYVLQFLSGFRRDRGFIENSMSASDSYANTHPAFPLTTATPNAEGPTIRSDTVFYYYKNLFNTGEIIFIYVIPALLHLNGFIIGIYIYRLADNEQLQCLIERVFILSNTPRRLVIALWLYFAVGVIWLGLSTAYIVILESDQYYMIQTQWFAQLSFEAQQFFKILLYISLFFHDLIQMVIITSYSLHCYLLRCYLYALKEKLLLHTIEPLDWMREICEFRKLLHHVNTKISLPVSCLTILNMSYTFSSIAHLFRDMNSCPIKIFSLSIANILVWMAISLVPYFQAASLTLTCRSTQSCGHLISIRPFVHRNTSSEDLNTVLLYASSLKMSAKLFKMPINAHYLCFIVLCCFVSILTFGLIS